MNSEIPIYSGLIIPQAWTLGLELSFYLIAPFILKRLNLIIILLIISILTRIYLYYIGLGLQDPWSYRFFPTELAFFLFGSLSHQIWKPYLLSRGILNKKLSLIAVCVVMLYCILFFLLPHREISALILFLLFKLTTISLSLSHLQPLAKKSPRIIYGGCVGSYFLTFIIPLSSMKYKLS